MAGRTTAPSTTTGRTQKNISQQGGAQRTARSGPALPRRARVVVLAAVAVAALAGCRAEALPGGPGTPTPSPTALPTAAPTPGPTTEPTGSPTTGPGAPVPPGGSDGVEVSVEIEPAFPMPNLVETKLKQARADLEKRGAASVVVVDARDPGAGTLPGASNGWTVCAQDPAGGDLLRGSATVTLAAAPNARQCP
ncbi:PASTA domain-containing protein [Cellulosimicrobium cellulans]|uniref:PASTA domain-containing protein n=1 Tax=Cellulosimicrobium cellulans TaxID=1710 RepID=UPI0028AFDD67|nr:PASTA domain-containing protein [Cellulosimicrobium cellulans]